MKKETRRKLETYGVRIVNFLGTSMLFGAAAGLTVAALHPKTKLGANLCLLAVGVSGGLMAEVVIEKTDPVLIETMNGWFAMVDGLEELKNALFSKPEEVETEE